MHDWFPFDIRRFNDPTRAGSDGLCGHPNCPCDARWMYRSGGYWHALCTPCRYELERQEHMKPRDTIRKFKLHRGRKRTPREAQPGPSFHRVPWRIARNGVTYKRRYQREET